MMPEARAMVENHDNPVISNHQALSHSTTVETKILTILTKPRGMGGLGIKLLKTAH